jgi:hypothetical protein
MLIKGLNQKVERDAFLRAVGTVTRFKVDEEFEKNPKLFGCFLPCATKPVQVVFVELSMQEYLKTDVTLILTEASLCSLPNI